MPTTPSTCPLDCPDACGILVESDADGRFQRLRGNPAHGYSRGGLCGKTAIYGELIESAERLLTPLVREGSKRDGPLREASWDEALARIAARVAPLREKPHRVLAAWYAGSMGRVQRYFPLRTMHALGAVFVDGGLCDNTASAGYEAVYGDVYGADVEAAGESDLLLLWGCDMRRTVQHLQGAAVEIAKRGEPVLAIDVYRTDTIRSIESRGGEGLLVRPGSDAALALGLARLAFERGRADRAFLAERCIGADRFEEHVRSGHDLAWTSARTGLAPERIERLAELLFAARAPFLKTGVGFARRRNGGMSMRAVCSLAAVLGVAERVHYESFSCFRLADSVIERPDLRPSNAPPRTIPHVQLGRELASGRYDAVFVWGHNPAVVCPEAARVRAALARDELFVVVHEQFRTETAALADVVLPATMFPEHADVYRSYGHRRLQYARRACDPPEGPRCNVDAFAAIARALELPRDCWDATSEALCDALVEATAPLQGLDAEQVARLRAGEAVRVEPAHALGHGTPSGRVELYSAKMEALGQPPMASYVPDDACGDAGAFWLVSAPSVHTHNSTFSHSARHLCRRGEHRVHLGLKDARRLGIGEGDWAELSNHRASLSFPVTITGDVPEGLVRIDGLPRALDVPERIGINALVPDALSDLGDGNVLYSTRVDVRRVAAPASR